AYQTTGQSEKAREALNKRLTYSLNAGAVAVAIDAIGELASFESENGQIAKAKELLLQGYQIASSETDLKSKGRLMSVEAVIAHKQGDIHRATNLLVQRIEIAKETNDRSGEGRDSWFLGSLLLAAGEPAKGLEYMQQSLDYFQSINHQS